MERAAFHGPPWSRQESLKEIAESLGVDFDLLIDGLAGGSSTEILAEELAVEPAVAKALKEHFFRYGVSSVMEGN